MAENRVLLTIPQLIQAVDGSCICNFSPLDGFTSVVTDSRNTLPFSLFVPLMGEFQDGHEYIEKALSSGANVVVVDNAHRKANSSAYEQLAKKHQACFISVDNTLKALQDAARFYVSLFPSLIKIGITGSSGKTTTKEIVASIFSEQYRVVMNEGNLNSETGLPLSVFKIRSGHQVGIFELGMNRRGEIAEIASVLSPSFALITNIGTAHIGILGTQQVIAEEKKSVFAFFTKTGIGFVPENGPWTDFLKDVTSGTIQTYGERTTPGFEGASSLGIDGTRIQYEHLDIRFPLPGSYNLKNALGAISLARTVGIDASLIKKGLEAVQPLFGRTEILKGEVTVLRDCYNANPDSMFSAIGFCADLEWTGRKIFVLGSMLELGDESAEAHRQICQQVRGSDAHAAFFFGSEMVAAAKGIDWSGIQSFLFEDIDALTRALKETLVAGDLVLVKGSRGMALERACSAIVPDLKVEASDD